MAKKIKPELQEKEFNQNLYALNAELINVFDKIAENEGELEIDDEARIAELSLLIKDKVDSCAGYHSFLKDQEEAVTKKIAELSALKSSIANKHYRYLKYLESCVLSTEEKEFKGNLCIIKAKKKIKVVKILDENKIPFEFLETKETTSISKTMIKKALDAGEEVEGAVLVDTETPSLIIKASL